LLNCFLPFAQNLVVYCSYWRYVLVFLLRLLYYLLICKSFKELFAFFRLRLQR